jgi:hypothetical protein
MIIKFKPGGIDWKRDYIFIPMETPFHRIMAEDFDDQVTSVTIVNTELVVSEDRPNCFGIHFPTLKKRLNKLTGGQIAPQFTLSDFEQFVIQIADLEDILEMNIAAIFNYR